MLLLSLLLGLLSLAGVAWIILIGSLLQRRWLVHEPDPPHTSGRLFPKRLAGVS